MTNARLPPYNRVAAGEDASDAIATNVEASDSGSRSFYANAILYIGIGSGALFVFGSIFYAQHCAQELANKIHGTVTWSPQLAGLFATFVWLCQMALVSIPFQMRLMTPILRRYTEEGFHTVGKVLKREMKVNGKNKFYKIVLLYQAGQDDLESFYAKKIEVEEKEFRQSEFSIVLIPDIPTSAILKRRYEALSDPCSKRNICQGVFSLAAPILWILAVYYGSIMEIYSQTDFWTQWGLGLLFLACLVSSICIGYMVVFKGTNELLHGCSCHIQRSRIPPALLGSNLTPNQTHNSGNLDGPLAAESEMELV